jgi:glycosyltransferase involved in cell wall biosynthesis
LTPLVSIIIPVYNTEKWLAESIESALNQTYHNKEIIIVDDGSTDSSYQIAKSYESDIVRVFQQENKGGSSARNYGFEKSHGEFIQYLDADDLIDNIKIEAQVNFVKKMPKAVSYCNWCYLINSEEDEKFHLSDPQLPLNKRNLLYSLLNEDRFIANHSFLWPRQAILDTGPWDVELTRVQDADFFIRAYFKGIKFVFFNEIYAYYRKNYFYDIKSISSIDNIDKIESKVKLLEKTAFLLIDNNMIDEYKLPLSRKFYNRAREAIWFSDEIATHAYNMFRSLSRDFNKSPKNFSAYIVRRLIFIQKKDLFFEDYFKKLITIRKERTITAFKDFRTILFISNVIPYSFLYIIYKININVV